MREKIYRRCFSNWNIDGAQQWFNKNLLDRKKWGFSRRHRTSYVIKKIKMWIFIRVELLHTLLKPFQSKKGQKNLRYIPKKKAVFFQFPHFFGPSYFETALCSTLYNESDKNITFLFTGIPPTEIGVLLLFWLKKTYLNNQGCNFLNGGLAFLQFRPRSRRLHRLLEKAWNLKHNHE